MMAFSRPKKLTCTDTDTESHWRERERADNTGVCKLADQVGSNRSPKYATSQDSLGQILRPFNKTFEQNYTVQPA